MTSSPMEQMRDVLERGDAKSARRLFQRHPELVSAVNQPLFSFDSPALVHFASREDPALIEVLLEFGADPNRRSDWWAGGFHALHSASGPAADRLLAAGAIPDACAAAHLDRPDLLRQMLEADAARVGERGGDGQTPLHFARSRAVVDLLLEAGADPDARDVDHRSTPAQWMLSRRRGAGRYDLAGYLVERGATADILLAAALGLVERVRSMLKENPALLDLKTTQGAYGEQPPSSFHIYMWTIGANLSPLQVASQFGQQETVQVMRGLASPVQQFLAACVQGDAAEARKLLRADPDMVGWLSPDDQRALPDGAWAADTPAVSLMLELGFDPRTPGHQGGTALHCAAWEGAADCVTEILRYPAARALVNHPDPTYGSTPLGWCCHGSRHCGAPNRDHPAVARLLLQAGACEAAGRDAATDAVRAVIDACSRRGT